MNNPMDKFQQNLTIDNQALQGDIFNIAARAKQNPKEFEDYIRKINPTGYQRAVQIRNSVNNPQQVIMQMIQQQGLNPNIIKMFNL